MRFCFLILGLNYSLFFSSSASGTNKIAISFSVEDYCPYICINEHNGKRNFANNPGYVIEILNKTFPTDEYKITYHKHPWQRGIFEIYKGSINGIALTAKEDAPDLVYPNVAQAISEGCFYARNGDVHTHLDKNDELEDKMLGLTLGYEDTEPLYSYLNKHIAAEKIIFLTGQRSFSRLLDMLKRDRVDLIYEDTNVAAYEIANAGLKQQVSAYHCLKQQLPLYVSFSAALSNSEDLARLLTKSVKQLRKSGELSAILQKYNMQDWR